MSIYLSLLYIVCWVRERERERERERGVAWEKEREISTTKYKTGNFYNMYKANLQWELLCINGSCLCYAHKL